VANHTDFFHRAGLSGYVGRHPSRLSQFLAEEEAKAKAKENVTADDYAERTPEARAKRFLEENLQYPAASFDALLLWDVLDYLEPSLAKLMIGQLTDLLRPGGVVFAMFHSKKPAGFQRYRGGRYEYIAGIVSEDDFPRPEGLSESRDSGSLRPLPDHEVVCRARPASGNSFYQVILCFIFCEDRREHSVVHFFGMFGKPGAFACSVAAAKAAVWRLKSKQFPS